MKSKGEGEDEGTKTKAPKQRKHAHKSKRKTKRTTKSLANESHTETESIAPLEAREESKPKLDVSPQPLPEEAAPERTQAHRNKKPNSTYSLRQCFVDLRAMELDLTTLEDARMAAWNRASFEFSCGQDANNRLRRHFCMSTMATFKSDMDATRGDCELMKVGSVVLQHLVRERLRLELELHLLAEENEVYSFQTRLINVRVVDTHKETEKVDTDLQKYMMFCHLRSISGSLSPGREVEIGHTLDKDMIIDRDIQSVVSAPMRALCALTVNNVNSGRIDAAISLLAKSKHNSKTPPCDKMVIGYLLGLCAIRKRQTVGALECTSYAMRRLAECPFSNSASHVPLLCAYAKSLRLNNQFEEAHPHLEEALQLRQASQHTREEAWAIKIDIAANLLDMGRQKEGGESLMCMLRAMRGLLLPHHHLVIKAKNYFARCLVRDMRLQEAEELMKRLVHVSFRPQNAPLFYEVAKKPLLFQIRTGKELIGLCGRTTNPLALFTIQTMTQIYRALENEKAAEILDDYVKAHGINFDIIYCRSLFPTFEYLQLHMRFHWIFEDL